MPTSSNDCHLCHIHDHNSPSTLLRTSTLRDNSPPPSRHHHHRRHGSRSRSGSIDNAYRESRHHHHSHDRHHHHHHHHDRHHGGSKVVGRVPSALARLSEHSAVQSLPASRSNTLQLYPEQVSVLPDGGHKYIGGDRASVRSLELTSPRHAADNRSNHSLIHTTTLQKPTTILSADLLANTLPPLTTHHGSQLSLNRQNSLPPPPPQPTPADFFMQVNRMPFKDDSRKHRFNLQTVMLIGCYALLFVMAIVIGIVLSYQNGWLGFGSPQNLIVESTSPGSPSSNSVLGIVDSDVDVFAGKGVRGSHELEKIQDGGGAGTQNINPPVHNVVQVRNPNAPRVNAAGVLSAGGQSEGRSISAGSDGVQNIPGQRPVQKVHDHVGVQHTSSVLNTMPVQTQSDHIQPNIPHFPQDINGAGGNFDIILEPGNPGILPENIGVPHPTLINPSPDIPVPSLVPAVPTVPRQQQPSSGGTIPGNAITTQTGRIIINAPPVIPPRNPFNVFPSNLQNGEFGNTPTNLDLPIPSDFNTNFPSNISTHPFADILLPHHHQPAINPNFDSHSDRVNQAFPNQPISFGGEHPNIRPGNQASLPPPNPSIVLNDQRLLPQIPRHQIPNEGAFPNNRPPQPSFSGASQGQFSNSVLNPGAEAPLIKKNQQNPEVNQIDMEKMKMLKEILDAEGSGKLLQDLINLNNNRNSLNAISQHLSEVTGHGPNPSIHSGVPQRNLANLATPAVLKHRDTINDSSGSFRNKDLVNLSPDRTPIVPVSTPRTINVNPTFIAFNPPTPAAVIPETTTPKSKSNIQVVRELLASLINSPEVQEILASRNKQRAQTQGRNAGGQVPSPDETGRVKVKGDEMRELLLKALAKEIPSGQSLQRLRLHGPQPSQTRQTSTRNRVSTRRGQKVIKQRGKITRAQQLVHFNTTSPSRISSRARTSSSLASRVLSNRMGESEKKFASVEHQSVRPPSTRRRKVESTRPLSAVTSRGRQKPIPHFTLRVKSDGQSEGSPKTPSSRHGRKIITESVEMKKGKEEGGTGKDEVVDGEVVRHWRHMYDDGTVSLGTVRRDGSFAFTNCRPAEMCGNDSKQ